MLRRSFFLRQSGGAGFSDATFGRALNESNSLASKESSTKKPSTLPGVGFTPGGPYARFPDYASRMLQSEDVRLKKAKAIGEGKDPDLVDRDPDQIRDRLSEQDLTDKFMTRSKKPDAEKEQEQGPGDRDDVPQAVARKMRRGQEYSSGPDTVATWYKIFGSTQAIPFKYESHPDFTIGYKDAPDSDMSKEAEEMRKKTGIMYFRRASENDGKSNNTNNNNTNNNIAQENQTLQPQPQKQTGPEQKSFAKKYLGEEETTNNVLNDPKKGPTIDENDFTDDPFMAAFTPNSNAAGKKREELLRSRRLQEEEMRMRGDAQNGDFSSAHQNMNNADGGSNPEKNNKSSSKSETDSSMGSAGGYNFARGQVGGSSVTEWREKIKRVRARGEGNLVIRLQGEIGYAHILAQTGLAEDAVECLEVGEYVWSKLQEMKRASPQSEGSTHGVVINVASAMCRAGRTAGKGEATNLWRERMTESDKAMRDNMEFVNKNDMNPRSMEPEKKTGPRKHTVSANAMWARLRNPWFGVKWARKSLGEDPDEGPRYTK